MGYQSETDRGFPIRLVLAAVAVVLLLVVVLQNSQTVSISVLVWDIEARLIWSLLAVAALGFVVGYLLPRFRR